METHSDRNSCSYLYNILCAETFVNVLRRMLDFSVSTFNSTVIGELGIIQPETDVISFLLKCPDESQ